MVAGASHLSFPPPEEQGRTGRAAPVQRPYQVTPFRITAGTSDGGPPHARKLRSAERKFLPSRRPAP